METDDIDPYSTLIRDLPEDEREELRTSLEAAGCSWQEVEGLTRREFAVWINAEADLSKAQLDHSSRTLSVMQQLHRMARPIWKKHDMPMWKVEYFLHGEARTRFQALLRELKEIEAIDRLEAEADQVIQTRGGV